MIQLSRKKEKTNETKHKVMRDHCKGTMKYEEKHKFKELSASLVELPDRIIEFLREHVPNGREIADDEFKIDIHITWTVHCSCYRRF